MQKMIKKLLNFLLFTLSNQKINNQTEEYLSQSINLHDLEMRQRELDQKKSWNRFQI